MPDCGPPVHEWHVEYVPSSAMSMVAVSTAISKHTLMSTYVCITHVRMCALHTPEVVHVLSEPKNVMV